MTYDDDAQLVRQCREGDERGFEALVRRYQGPVYHVALRMVRDPEEARDLAQTVFLKIYQHLDGYSRLRREEERVDGRLVDYRVVLDPDDRRPTVSMVVDLAVDPLDQYVAHRDGGDPETVGGGIA